MLSSIIAFSDNVLPILVNLSTTFGWNITSVFFRRIVNPNRRAALAKESVILFISLIECAMSGQSSDGSLSSYASILPLMREEQDVDLY